MSENIQVRKDLVDVTAKLSELIRAVDRLTDRVARMDRAIDDLQDQVVKLLPDDNEPETSWHDVNRIECYTSNSGNKTWKAFTSDSRIIYLRQAHHDLLKSSGLWEDLDVMLPGDECDADLMIETIPDGDFMRPVGLRGSILSWIDGADDMTRLRRVMESTDFIVLDTETTGLDGYVVQVAAIAPDGETLINRLIKPPCSIPAGASAVHGITDAMVENAVSYPHVMMDLAAMIAGTHVIAYNASFDRGDLERTARHYMVSHPVEAKRLLAAIDGARWIDAMELFAPIFGEWNNYHKNFKWQKLETAARYYDISTDGAHNALNDAQMTLAVVREMVKDNQ